MKFIVLLIIQTTSTRGLALQSKHYSNPLVLKRKLVFVVYASDK